MRIHAMAIAAAGTLGLALALSSPASAQPVGSYSAYGPSDSENVTVYGPRYHVERNSFTGLVEKASLSVPVSYADLDLRTREGAHEFRARIRQAAAQICDDLDARFRSANPGSPECFREAVANARPNVDAAIDAARGYYGGY